MITLKDIANAIEEIAPSNYQESYDNAGLLIGNQTDEVHKALLTIDVTEAVIDEAINEKADLIIAHHPLIFSGLKRLNGKNDVERCVIKAIRNNIAIYVAHTNLDSVPGGVNSKICEKIGLKNCTILQPVNHDLLKLVTFVPQNDAEKVRAALFSAGAGHIGDYDQCSYNLKGEGTFRAGANTTPHVGEIGQIHTEAETRIETIMPKHLKSSIINALLSAHPYEEVAYDIYALENSNPQIGIGMIGELPIPEDETEFLLRIKEIFGCQAIRHTHLSGKKVTKIAVCGGSGSFLLNNAKASGAGIFVTGDYKYHQFFEAENKIVIADIGHYESEQFTKEVFYEILTKKFPNFALRLSQVETNPVYFL